MRNLTIIFLLSILFTVGCHVEKDMAMVRAAAAQIHSQMQAVNYTAIYRESAPRFKTVGTEPQFIETMEQFRKEVGLLKKANEIAYQTGLDSNAGRTHTLIFDLEFEKGHVREHLIFTRSETGQMQLWKLDMDPTR